MSPRMHSGVKHLEDYNGTVYKRCDGAVQAAVGAPTRGTWHLSQTGEEREGSSAEVMPALRPTNN